MSAAAPAAEESPAAEAPADGKTDYHMSLKQIARINKYYIWIFIQLTSLTDSLCNSLDSLQSQHVHHHLIEHVPAA